MKRVSGKGRVRFQVEFDDTRNNYFEEMVELTGCQTKKEFVANAFTLVRWAVKEKQKGHKVGSLDPTTNKFFELLMPFLDVPEKPGD